MLRKETKFRGFRIGWIMEGGMTRKMINKSSLSYADRQVRIADSVWILRKIPSQKMKKDEEGR